MKKFTLYLLLGVVAGMVISSIFKWIGIPSPGQAYANVLSSVFGEPDGFNSLLMILLSGVLIVLILLGAIKLSKRFEKGKRPSS